MDRVVACPQKDAGEGDRRERQDHKAGDCAPTQAAPATQPRGAHGDELGEPSRNPELARIGTCKPALRLAQLDVIEEGGPAVVLLPRSHMSLESTARELGIPAL